MLDIISKWVEIENNIKLYKIRVADMTDEVYDTIKPLVSYIGGCWREKDKAFVFSFDPEVMLDDMLIKYNKWCKGYTDCKEESKIKGLQGMSVNRHTLPVLYRMWQEKLQFYPTPDSLAEKVVGMCGITEDDVVLEPSAGQGGLVRYIPKCKNLIVVEPDIDNCALLTKYFGVVPLISTFEAISKQHLKKVDKVVMNPPFSEFRDLKHVRIAYDLLETGGRLVAIISENNLYYDSKETTDFKIFLKEVGGVVHSVPFGTFSSSGTMVYTCIVEINK